MKNHSGSDGFCHFVILKTSGEIDLENPSWEQMETILNFDLAIVFPPSICIIMSERIVSFWCLGVDWPKFLVSMVLKFRGTAIISTLRAQVREFHHSNNNSCFLMTTISCLYENRLGIVENVSSGVSIDIFSSFEFVVLANQLLSFQFACEHEIFMNSCSPQVSCSWTELLCVLLLVCSCRRVNFLCLFCPKPSIMALTSLMILLSHSWNFWRSAFIINSIQILTVVLLFTFQD